MAEHKKSSIVQLYESLTQKATEPDRLAESYFRTFSSPYGQIVLTHLLAELHVFDEVLTEEEVALSNFGKKLLGYMGVINENNIKDVVKFYISIAKRNIEAEMEQNSKTREG